MSLKLKTSNGRLEYARARFGRNNKKGITVNYYDGCTYLHLKNFKNGKTYSLGIDEYEEISELLLDTLQKLDERYRNEVCCIIIVFVFLSFNFMLPAKV